ncbi:MAG: hypothetical protein GWP05_07195 [Anaerolineaceae bacterium]|nr:hypothetical protein [Anaerolineaceae bacterium]
MMCDMPEQRIEIRVSPHPQVWQPTRRQVVVVTVLVGLLYAFAVNNQWRFGNDSALYLSAGRSLAAGQGFSGNHGASPGLPILVAASYMIFGEALWPINLLLSAMGFATAVLTYRIVRFDRSRRTALNVFLLTGLSVALYVHSLSIESDVPALFCLTAALWSLQKFTRGGWRWLPVGVLMLLASAAMRMVGGVIVVTVAVALVFEKCRLPLWKRLVGGLAVAGSLAAAVLAGGWLLGNGQGLGGYFQAISGRFTEYVDWANLSGHALLEFPPNCLKLFTGQTLPLAGSAPLLGLVVYGALRMLKRRKMLIVLPPLVYVGMLIVLWGDPADRYLILVLPPLVYLFVDGLLALAGAALGIWRREHNAQVYASIAVAIFLAVNLPKVLREGLYRSHHPRFAEVVEHGKLSRWQPVADFLKQQELAADEVILTPQAPVVRFLTNQRTVNAMDASDEALGMWQIVRQGLGDSQVRFVVLPIDRKSNGLFSYLKHLNRKRWKKPVVRTSHYEVYACPRGTFIFPPKDYPRMWR